MSEKFYWTQPDKYHRPLVFSKDKDTNLTATEIVDLLNFYHNELLDTNGIIGKKDDNNTNLESFDSELSFSNNPFNLKFEFIEKKQFKEFPYDNDNYYYLGDNISNEFFKKSEENEIKNEKNEFDDVCIRQLTTSYYK